MSNAPLRITHYFPVVRLADGGIARAVLDLCKVFADRGHQVQLLCHEPKDVPAEWMSTQPGLPRAVVANRPASRLALLKPVAAELDALRQTDVLHLHAPWELGNIRMAHQARKLGVPYVLSVHGMLDDWSMAQRSLKKRVFLALVGRSLLNRAASVHFTAEAELAQAKKWFSNPNTSVLPCLVDWSAFERLPGPEAGLQLIPEPWRQKHRILFLSRLHEKKGVDLLIRAVAMIRDAGVNSAVLLIAGIGDPAYVDRLKTLASELNLTDRIVFLGMISGQAKISLLQAVDLLALPTQQENFGLVLPEAMACRTPVVTTRGTDIWQEIQAAGAVITERTAADFARQMTALLNDPSDRARRGAMGREWVFSALSVGPLSEKYEALYRNLRV
jgi:glycosyltransferase involved in cell wall biosynthesis